MVLVTKYRHPVLVGPVQETVYSTISSIFSQKGLVLLEINGEPDHVHLLYEADPFTAPGTLVNIIKTKKHRVMLENYTEKHCCVNIIGSPISGQTVILLRQ